MGKIKKILENELIGGTQNTDVYPVTSTKAVYDTSNKVLDDYIQHLKKTSTFAGIATPTTNPGTPDGNVFYLATEAGVYTHFDGISVAVEEVAILEWKGSWIKKTTDFATQQQIVRLDEKIDDKTNEINVAKEEALQAIAENEKSAITNFNSQRVTPEMLSESTKQLIEASGGGTITNLPDDEDLTSVDDGTGSNVLKFADRTYNPSNFSGNGYKILRKNIIDGKNVLTQNMINQPNTIYEIRYDYTLDNKKITIPEGCILKFKGGSLSNGTVYGNSTKIINSINTIFFNIVLKNTFIDNCYSSWFYNTFDDTDNILWENLLKFEIVDINSVIKNIDVMKLTDVSIERENSFILNGNGYTIKYSFTKEAHGNILISCNSENVIIRDINFEQTNELTDFNNGHPFGTAFYIINIHEKVKYALLYNINSFICYDRFLAINKNTEKVIIENCNLKHNSFIIEGFGKELIIKSSVFLLSDTNRYKLDILSSGNQGMENVYIYNSKILGGIEFINGSFYAYYSTFALPSIGERSAGSSWLDEVIFNNCNFIGYGNKYIDDCYIYSRGIHKLVFDNCNIDCPALFQNTEANRDFTYLKFERIDNLEFNSCNIKLYQVPKHDYWNPELRASNCPIIQINNCNIINASGVKKQIIIILENEKNVYSDITARQLSLIDKNIIFGLSDSAKQSTELVNKIARLTSNIQIINNTGTFDKRPTTGIEIGQTYFCTDKQTTEGLRNGIMIYYTGNDTWVDALGRVIN